MDDWLLELKHGTPALNCILMAGAFEVDSLLGGPWMAKLASLLPLKSPWRHLHLRVYAHAEH